MLKNAQDTFVVLCQYCSADQGVGNVPRCLPYYGLWTTTRPPIVHHQTAWSIGPRPCPNHSAHHVPNRPPATDAAAQPHTVLNSQFIYTFRPPTRHDPHAAPPANLTQNHTQQHPHKGSVARRQHNPPGSVAWHCMASRQFARPNGMASRPIRQGRRHDAARLQHNPTGSVAWHGVKTIRQGQWHGVKTFRSRTYPTNPAPYERTYLHTHPPFTTPKSIHHPT